MGHETRKIHATETSKPSNGRAVDDCRNWRGGCLGAGDVGGEVMQNTVEDVIFWFAVVAILALLVMAMA